MTRDEIKNMEAGRELDTAIAELMGRPFRKPTHGICCTCQVCGWDYDNCQCGYSDFIEMAWQVVEKLTDLDLDEQMRTFKLVRASKWVTPKGEYNPWGYDAYFGIRYDARHFQELVAWADTAPLAICRAALLAVQEGNDEP